MKKSFIFIFVLLHAVGGDATYTINCDKIIYIRNYGGHVNEVVTSNTESIPVIDSVKYITNGCKISTFKE